MITAEIAGTGDAFATDPRPCPWWSVTKTVLAAAALRLVEHGKLALDDPVAGAPYTLRQLLQHTAGVPNYGGLVDYHAAVGRGDPPWSEAELLDRVDATQLDFAPGQGWHYSNVGYMYVRHLVERATDLPTNAALTELVFQPLGITARIAETPEDLAATPWGNAAAYHPHWVYHRLVIGAAGEAAAFMHRLLTGGLLSPATLRDMTTPHPLGGAIPGRPWLTTGYGLGLMIGEVDLGNGRRTLAQGHSGVGPADVCAVYHLPALSPPVTAAAFAQADSEAVTEHQVIRRAAALLTGEA